jgi:hypothetical protein
MELFLFISLTALLSGKKISQLPCFGDRNCFFGNTSLQNISDGLLGRRGPNPPKRQLKKSGRKRVRNLFK